MKTVLRMKKPLCVPAASGAVLVNGKKVSLSDIVAFRYDFDENDWVIGEGDNLEVGAEAVRAISCNRKVFERSVHIVELHTKHKYSLAGIVGYLRSVIPKVAILVHMTYDLEHVDFATEMVWLKEAVAFGIDRVLIHDVNDILTVRSVSELIKEVSKQIGVHEKDIGLCDSPLGCSLGIGCLSAMKCRELAAEYGDCFDMVIPSKNNEADSQSGLLSCSCVGSIVVERFEPYVAEKSAVGTPKDMEEDGSVPTGKKAAPKKKNAVTRWGGLK